MSLPTDIPFNGTLVPAGPFPGGYANLNQGGYHTFDTLTDLNNCPDYLKVVGMLGFVIANNTLYRYKSDAAWEAVIDATAVEFSSTAKKGSIIAVHQDFPSMINAAAVASVNFGSDTSESGFGVTGDYAAILAGDSNNVNGDYSAVLSGSFNSVTGQASVISGGTNNNIAGNNCFIGGGDSNTVSADNGSICCGSSCTVTGQYSFAEGVNQNVSGTRSHAEGGFHVVGGDQSHAEGNNNTISAGATNAHAEGDNHTISGSGASAHAEGTQHNVYGNAAHAEGYGNVAGGDFSHVQNLSCQSLGRASSATGTQTTATAEASFSMGTNSTATRDSQFAYAAGQRGTLGDTQTSLLVFRGTTDGIGVGETSELGFGAVGIPFSCEANKSYAMRLTASVAGTQAGPVRLSAALERTVCFYWDGTNPVVVEAQSTLVVTGNAGAADWTLDVTPGALLGDITVTFSTGTTQTATFIACRADFTETVLPA